MKDTLSSLITRASSDVSSKSSQNQSKNVNEKRKKVSRNK